jgi:hypothetical protein
VHTNQSTSTHDKTKQNMFDLDPSGSIFAPSKIRKPSHLFILRLVSDVARIWRTVPTPEARIVKGREIVQNLYFYPTVKTQFFRYTF